jgi:ribosomal protein S18 acetylase RimI-like enzyme
MPASTVRDATPRDCAALAALDLTYESSRHLVIDRQGEGAAITWRAPWRHAPPATLTYATYTTNGLRGAFDNPNLARFLVAHLEGAPAGLLLILTHPWTDAGEITDFAVGRHHRRNGVGAALLDAAIAAARASSMRSLWVEPRADNHTAIEFYLHRDFRISGFNDRMYANDDHLPGRTTIFMHLELHPPG